MNKQKILTLSLSAMFFLAASCVVYSWTEPATMPSLYNPPINTSSTAQTKAGEIGASLFRDYNSSDYYVDPSGESVIYGISKTNSRVDSSEKYPLGHYSSGDTVFSIDPTWSQVELQKYFNSTSVTWNTDSTAPGGYAIYINGALNVGGEYNSGFPYISVEEGDIFYMEVWIKNVGTNQTHYMGSMEYGSTFNLLGGNPGSYGYWLMSSTNPGSSWVKKSGYISGFGTATGTFKTGTKYWTPQALFNYGAGTGTRACMISGWKVIKVSSSGDRIFTGNIKDGALNVIYNSSTKKIERARLPFEQGDITSDVDTNSWDGGYYNVANLTPANVKNGVSFGRNQVGTFVGVPTNYCATNPIGAASGTILMWPRACGVNPVSGATCPYGSDCSLSCNGNYRIAWSGGGGGGLFCYLQTSYGSSPEACGICVVP